MDGQMDRRFEVKELQPLLCNDCNSAEHKALAVI